MQHASPETVLGNFADVEITVGPVTSRFFRRDGKYWINTDGPDGAMQDFEIAYTFGLSPLQQYLVAFPDGRLQALPLAWDSRPATEGGQRWYHLYPNETIAHDDELHWTGLQQNWNYMCADCHSTNLVRGYDPGTDRFNTTWSEISIGCESCHGPGGKHLAWVGDPGRLEEADLDRGLALLFDERKGVSWSADANSGKPKRSVPNERRLEVEACAACHSRRGTLAAGHEGSARFLDHFQPALLTETLYHPDGQIQDEVYEWGSFAQSRMSAAGVTCSDCHDPHSLQLRAPGAAVCAQCHEPARYAQLEHHGHPRNSPGSDCLACHMPETTYMVVDARRDHSLRIPRPDLSLEFGTPNACASCHTDRTPEQLAQDFGRMFPNPGKPFQHWTRAFSQARAGQPQAEISLLTVLNDRQTPEIARATAMLELGHFLSPLSGQALQAALHDPGPLVRIAALRALETVPPANRFMFAGHLLRDELLAVRTEAARVLAATPLDQMEVADRGALRIALDDYIATQQFHGERPETRLNLGNLAIDTGDPVLAESRFREALKRDPRFTPARINLADLYRNQGLEREGRKLLQEGLTLQPQAADLHHAMGLALVRSGDLTGALPELASAAELDPDNPRYVFVQGVALNSAGQTDEAIRVLAAGQLKHPADRELLLALATMERDRGRTQEALAWARQLQALDPANPEVARLLEALEAGR